MGLIYQNTIPIIPANGPFDPYYTEANIYQAKFTEAEDILLIVLKLLGIGFWSLTISKLIHAITVLGNPATVAYQQVRAPRHRPWIAVASAARLPLTPRPSSHDLPSSHAAGH